MRRFLALFSGILNLEGYIMASLIFGGNMTADPDAPLQVQSALSHAFAANILKDRNISRRIGMTEDQIWNQLFESGIGFRFASRTELDVLIEKNISIPVNIGTEPLKMSQCMKNLRGDY